MASLNDFIQNIDKKKLLIILGVAGLSAGLLFFAFSPFFIADRIETEEELKDRALEDAEFSSVNERGFITASIVSVPEENFQITYQEEIDTFNIYIHTGDRSSEIFLSQEEVLHSREVAEQYFLSEVLKTQDKKLACRLNVRVSTSGYGDFFITPSPLSFCK